LDDIATARATTPSRPPDEGSETPDEGTLAYRPRSGPADPFRPPEGFEVTPAGMRDPAVDHSKILAELRRGEKQIKESLRALQRPAAKGRWALEASRMRPTRPYGTPIPKARTGLREPVKPGPLFGLRGPSPTLSAGALEVP